MSHVDILLAEDFATFREFVSRELRQRPEFRVVEVSDGLAAVQQAEQLRPDLVLLDIGLPGLDGLSAARRIRSITPESGIVFVTQESAPEVIHEALALGSLGYVHKSRARHVLPLVESILDERQTPRVPHHHQAQFCADETTMLETAERFLGSALSATDAVIACVTASHMQQLRERLKNGGSDVDSALERGSFVHLDADQLAASVRADGVSHWKPALVQVVQSAASATTGPPRRVAIFGECAPALCASGHFDLALELEAFGTELVNTMSVELMCAYPMMPANNTAGFKSVCSHHGAVIVR